MDCRKFLAGAARVRDAAGRTCTRRDLVRAAAFGRLGGGRVTVSATRLGESRSGDTGAAHEAIAAHRHPFVAFVIAGGAEPPQAARANPNTCGVHVRAEGSRIRRAPLARNAKRVVAVALMALRVSS